MARKVAWRYAPTTVFTRFGKLQVIAYRAHPPGQHPPGCPLVPTCIALELVTQCGSVWLGCGEAKINAQLRMIVRGGEITNPRNELTRKWRRVPPSLS